MSKKNQSRNLLQKLVRLIRKPLLDLLIVIVGVSVAFMLSNIKDGQRVKAEREKVLGSLRSEIMVLNNFFPSMSAYQADKADEWDSLLRIGQISDFQYYRYIQPQYNYEVIEFAINARDSEVVDFVLHEKLLKLYKSIKMLEQTENYMTDIALQYQPAMSEEVKARNQFLFERFAGFGRDRARTLQVISASSAEILPEIEKRMDVVLSFQDIHDRAIVIDTHNDILTQTMEKGIVFDNDLAGKAHTDLARLKQGGVDLQFFSVWSDGDKLQPFDFAVRQMDSLDAVIKRNPARIVRASNSREVLNAAGQGKIAAMMGAEGGHQIENDLSKLDYFYERGVRYMTLTWNNSTDWATSAADETFNKELNRKGLTDFGREVVGRMNDLGMMVDISHVGEQTFYDVIDATTKPVIASHSSVYSLCPHPRNLKDDQIKAVAKNGGVIQVNFYSAFLDKDYQERKDAFIAQHKAESDSLLQTNMPDYLADEFLFSKYPGEVVALRPPLSLVIQHIEYIIRLVGVDYVGLGSDFDGIESAPLELDDVTTYPLITKALLDKGYSTEDITKVLGGNLLRVLKANEGH